MTMSERQYIPRERERESALFDNRPRERLGFLVAKKTTALPSVSLHAGVTDEERVSCGVRHESSRRKLRDHVQIARILVWEQSEWGATPKGKKSHRTQRSTVVARWKAPSLRRAARASTPQQAFIFLFKKEQDFQRANPSNKKVPQKTMTLSIYGRTRLNPPDTPPRRAAALVKQQAKSSILGSPKDRYFPRSFHAKDYNGMQ